MKTGFWDSSCLSAAAATSPRQRLFITGRSAGPGWFTVFVDVTNHYYAHNNWNRTPPRASSLRIFPFCLCMVVRSSSKRRKASSGSRKNPRRNGTGLLCSRSRRYLLRAWRCCIVVERFPDVLCTLTVYNHRVIYDFPTQSRLWRDDFDVDTRSLGYVNTIFNFSKQGNIS